MVPPCDVMQSQVKEFAKHLEQTKILLRSFDENLQMRALKTELSALETEVLTYCKLEKHQALCQKIAMQKVEKDGEIRELNEAIDEMGRNNA